MKWWLTTHFPHQSPKHPWNIYLRDQYRTRFEREIEIGDYVAFYELQGRLGNGRKAVIGFGRVTGALGENKNREGGKDEGDKIWEWQIPCGHYDWKIVPHETVCRIIGRKSRGALRLRGGLKELDEQQFDLLKRNSR